MTKLEPLPGPPDWEMWTVTSFAANTTTWCARPVGSPRACAHADSMTGLIAAAVNWLDRPQSEIDATIADLRRKLDGTPWKYEQERRHLAACIETEVTARSSRARAS